MKQELIHQKTADRLSLKELWVMVRLINEKFLVIKQFFLTLGSLILGI